MDSNRKKMGNEELERIVEKDKEREKYLDNTKFLGGMAIYKKYTVEERAKKIVDLDYTFKEYKVEFRKRLEE